MFDSGFGIETKKNGQPMAESTLRSTADAMKAVHQRRIIHDIQRKDI
jgi:hypothetical protein